MSLLLSGHRIGFAVCLLMCIAGAVCSLVAAGIPPFPRLLLVAMQALLANYYVSRLRGRVARVLYFYRSAAKDPIFRPGDALAVVCSLILLPGALSNF